MNRHKNHQIDELAQINLRQTLPLTWVLNEQRIDYGKDYLVELGDDDGELTGSGFYIQLKGQNGVLFRSEGQMVKYSLEAKYASYYLDKVKDLPVFLVVVDVSQKKGWWLFLQPVLASDQSWRGKGSVTLYLPVSNSLSDTTGFRTAIEEAKEWMRQNHPTSIHDAVLAHKRRITRIDPRFDVDVSLVDNHPHFGLRAKEVVDLQFVFSGQKEVLEKKLSDLIDKGALVSFQPGEVKVTGSKLFEQIEKVGCVIQTSVNFDATLTLICKDGSGTELARLNEIPGQFSGGQKELCFNGGFQNSPLSLMFGPIGPSLGGSVNMNLNLHKWDGQRLSQLAYFERLYQFFKTLPQSALTTIEVQKDGNGVLSLTVPLQGEAFVFPFAEYLELLNKARAVGKRFGVDPVWTFGKLNKESEEDVEQMYSVFLENGWIAQRPKMTVAAKCVRKTFRFDVAKKATNPSPARISSFCTYDFFGEKIEVGELNFDFSEVSLVVKDGTKPNPKRKDKGKHKPMKSSKALRRSDVEILLIGSPNNVMRVTASESK